MSIDKQNVYWPGWETVRLIGRGSFGAVYEIQRDIFGEIEKAALKVISIPQNAGDIDEMYSDGYEEENITSVFQDHLQSIIAEYTLMRKMNGYTNIVSCDDVRYIQHDDGIGWDIFIKMELLTPLPKALPLEISEEMTLKIAKDICRALELCKNHEIIHRDIKPQNIFVSQNGDYKLGDFGIAKTVEKTMGGTKIGTYKYMAPEVYHNRPYGSTADIYSLGLVLYWLLNERRMPFLPLHPVKLNVEMDEQARNRRLSGERFAEPKNGSKELKAIVMKACAYDVADRYSSASEMLHALNQIEKRTDTDLAISRSNPFFSEHKELEKEEKTVGVFEKCSEKVAEEEDFEEKTVGLFYKSETGQKCEVVGDDESVQSEERSKENAVLEKETNAAIAEVCSGDLGQGEVEQKNVFRRLKKSKKMFVCVGVAVILLCFYHLLELKGVFRVEETWTNGAVKIQALDKSTLRIDIEDERSDHQYKDLGTPWEVEIFFGPWLSEGEVVSTVELESLALRKMNREKKGYTDTYSSESNLHIRNNEVGASFNGHLEIEQNRNTYTAIIELPKWFEISRFISARIILYEETKNNEIKSYETHDIF